MPTNKKNLSCKPPAIQGKLTEQLPTDGDAKDLLKQIQAEKNKLIEEGKIKSVEILAAYRGGRFLQSLSFDLNNADFYNRTI